MKGEVATEYASSTILIKKAKALTLNIDEGVGVNSGRGKATV